MADKPTISLATVEDVPEILSMIHELANYEKEPSSSVLATEESLRRTLTFAPSKTSSINPNAGPGYAKTLIIRLPAQPSNSSDVPGAVAGMAMFFNNYSTWRSAPGVYLEDLFVRPAYRKRGYATLMIRELAREVKRIHGGRLEWKCLDWNEPSLKFYHQLGAVEQKEWVGLRVDGEALEKLAAE